MRRYAPWVYGSAVVLEALVAGYCLASLLVDPSISAVVGLVLGTFFAWKIGLWWMESLKERT